MVELMERLCNLYFELSNEERLGILYLLEDNPSTLTGLSESLGIRNQQCSRHLARLTENGLIEKTVGRGYDLSEYGSAILRLQPTFSFLTNHSEYFREHSTAGIPEIFITSIGLLRGATLVQNLNLALFTIERIIEESEEALFEVTNQFHINTIKPRNEALKRGVKIHSIESQVAVMPGEIREWFRSNPDYLSTAHEARDNGLVHEKVTPRISYLMHMSEKEGFITFPATDGTFDCIGFSSKDPEFLLWCKELFDSTWKKSMLKGMKIKEIYAKVLEDDSLAKSILEFAGENQSLVHIGLAVGSELTVIAEVVRLYLTRGVPLRVVEPEFYWKQMQ
jgi:predicted transcriptional regulator